MRLSLLQRCGRLPRDSAGGGRVDEQRVECSPASLMTGGACPAGGLSRELHMPCTTAFLARTRTSRVNLVFPFSTESPALVMPRASSGDDEDDSDDDGSSDDPLDDEESDFDDFDDDFDDDFEEETGDPDWDHQEEESPEMPPGKKK